MSGAHIPLSVARLAALCMPGGAQIWTTYSYDASGRTISVTAADGSVTQYLYQGNQTTVTDPAGKTKTFTTDAMGVFV